MEGLINAKTKALSLLEKYCITQPIVNIFEIAQNEGVQIQFAEMPIGDEDVAGFLDEKIIYVNKEDPANRQTFTIAHELGHFMLQHKPSEFGVLYRRLLANNSSLVDKEANCFAANLLVPEKMLKEMIQKWNIDKNNTFILAKLFGVSTDVMKIRLQKI